MEDIKVKIIIEILESYLEFIEMVQNDNKEVVQAMAKYKKEKWKPILEELKGN